MIATPTKPRRVELILRQIDSLPTLPAIATRLLSLTADDEARARDVVDLIAADPALTAKVLSLCRSADRGLHEEVVTIERAVVLLGFNAIRSAVLSVKVFEAFNARRTSGDTNAARGAAADDAPSQEISFDREAFWTHSLAVAILAEQIAAATEHRRDLDPSEAFVCGLLHDVGKLALDHVLPKSFNRVIESTEINQGNIAEYERRIIGLDHHTAGKRLAEQWGLPHRLQDCIWLHATPYDTLPKLEHQRLIGLITLADLLARRHHVGYSGNHTFTQQRDVLMDRLDLRPAAVDRAVERLHQELEIRGKALGLHDEPSQVLFLQSIQRANEALGRLNSAMDRRSRAAASQARILDAVVAFHNNMTPGQRVQDVLDATVESARSVLGAGFYAMVYPNDTHAAADSDDGDGWLVTQYNDQGKPTHAQYIDVPPHTPDLRGVDSQSVGLDLMGILPWLADYLIESPDLRKVRLLPLTCGWGTAALLLHDRETLPRGSQLLALTSTWGAAIAGAAQHDGARRLGEELAQANSALADAQDQLLRHASMARLGEMSAGAAHEMNNPLAVISGRSQLLSMALQPGSNEHKAAQTIFQEAHRLSDLITCMRMFADPPQAQRTSVDVGVLLDETVRKAAAAHLSPRDGNPIALQVRQPMPPVPLDQEMVRRAVTDLLANALQAKPKQSVQVLAQISESAQSLTIQVADDGDGMDEHTLAHCTDPFFSARSAGRGVGIGLARVQQLAAAHGGRLDLRSTPDKGTVATLILPLDSTA